MATETMLEIDWDTFPESDGEPMAETQANATQMMDLTFALSYVFQVQERDDRTAVGGNQLMYFNRDNGREHVAPDVYVIFDYAPPPPPSWKMWEHGKFPEIVFEITSPSTADIDVSEQVGKGKRWRYGMLGVREYFIYDPQGELDPPLQGFALKGTRLEPMETLPGGSIYSPLLGAELRQVGEFLRVIDPQNGSVIMTAEEDRRVRIATQGQLAAAQEQLADAQEQLAATEEARVAAEERAARAEEMLRDALAGDPPTLSE